MKNENCAYCMHGELLDQFGIYICDLKDSEVFLFKEQSKTGRVIVAAKQHVSEIVNLTSDERNGFFSDVAQVAEALHKLYKPGKINYGAYGDKGGHLHMHLVPKYEDGDEWGGTFEMNPNKTYLAQEGYDQLVDEIKKALVVA
jgi:diadenosine tetraphosphate (Ap4A) HIT family hydrolase